MNERIEHYIETKKNEEIADLIYSLIHSYCYPEKQRRVMAQRSAIILKGRLKDKNGKAKKSFAKLGKELGVSGMRIRQIYFKASFWITKAYKTGLI